MDPRIDKLREYQIGIGTRIPAIEVMQTVEQAIELYKKYVSDPYFYPHEIYKNISKKIEELFPEEIFIWRLEQ